MAQKKNAMVSGSFGTGYYTVDAEDDKKIDYDENFSENSTQNPQNQNLDLDNSTRTYIPRRHIYISKILDFIGFLLIVSVFIMCIVILTNQNNIINNDSNEDDNSGNQLPISCFDPNYVNLEGEACWADFVVMGCGSGGSTASYLLSNPLAGGKQYSVICLEKSENYNADFIINQAVVNGTPYFLFSGRLAKYTETFASAFDNQLPNYINEISQGIMVGGTGNHDYCVDIEPSPLLAAKLQTASGSGAGDIQWDYNTLISIMREYEEYQGPVSSSCSRGTTGLLSVVNIPYDVPGTAGYLMMDAIVANLPADSTMSTHTNDLNCDETSFTENIQSFYRPEVNSGNYARSSPGLDYLGPDIIDSAGFGLNGRMLRVITNAYVKRFNTNSVGIADRVEAIVNGKERHFYARKQIISALGALRTPMVTQLSGYGPAAVLEAAQVPIIKDMPEVGNGLQEHYGSLIAIETDNVVTQGFVTGQGLLSVIPEKNGLRSAQIYLIPVNPGFPESTAKLIGFNNMVPPEASLVVAFNVISPESRGSVTITNPSPFQTPQVTFNSYSDTNNLDLKLITTLATAINNAVISLNSNYLHTYSVLYPPPEAFAGNLTILESYIKALPFFQNHYSSTMQMGKVVDANLKLMNVQGVTIADNSAWPFINNGNTRTQAIITATQAAKYLLATSSPPL